MTTAVLAVMAVVSLAVLVLSIGLVVDLGAQQLHTPQAIARDGPRPGRPAPPLDVHAIDGASITVPVGRRQVLLFADHSLIDFEDLLPLLTGDDRERPELVVLGSADRTSPALVDGLGLAVPAAVVPHELYHRYRIRVMPYAVVIDGDGRVVTSGLVNTAYQLRHLAQVGSDLGSASAPATTHGSGT